MDRSECPLSRLELETLQRVVRGESQGEIALARGVSHSTVRQHMHRAYRKLGVGNAIQAYAVLLREGWAGLAAIAPEDRYSTWLRATKHDMQWLPSAAQRCYLNAFTRLLWRRDVASALAAHLAFQLMCVESGVPVSRDTFDPVRALARLDDMLGMLARCLTRPLYDGLEVAA